MATTHEQSEVTLTVPTGAKTAEDTFHSGRYHFLFSLSPEVNDVIEKLALRYRMSKGDLLNHAIGLLKFLSDEASQGKRIGVAFPDQELEIEVTDL